jgi:hypothetical protein
MQHRQGLADTALPLRRFCSCHRKFRPGCYDLETTGTSIGARLERKVTPRAA